MTGDCEPAEDLRAILWEDSLGVARIRAPHGVPILVAFAGGSDAVTMDDSTFSNPQVIEFINQHCLPVRLLADQHRELAYEYLVNWTPTALVLDRAGRVHGRMEGLLEPDAFLAQLALGHGKYLLHARCYLDAAERFEDVQRLHPSSEVAAEALYWLGVARYRASSDITLLKTTWARLVESHPGSGWVGRTGQSQYVPRPEGGLPPANRVSRLYGPVRAL